MEKVWCHGTESLVQIWCKFGARKLCQKWRLWRSPHLVQGWYIFGPRAHQEKSAKAVPFFNISQIIYTCLPDTYSRVSREFRLPDNFQYIISLLICLRHMQHRPHPFPTRCNTLLRIMMYSETKGIMSFGHFMVRQIRSNVVTQTTVMIFAIAFVQWGRFVLFYEMSTVLYVHYVAVDGVRAEMAHDECVWKGFVGNVMLQWSNLCGFPILDSFFLYSNKVYLPMN